MTSPSSILRDLINLMQQGYVPGSPVYIGLWANKPAVTAVAVGSQIIVTDVGAGGRSSWFSDGVNWRPVNGRVLLANQQGTAAAPLATITGNGLGQTAALAVIPVIPANMLVVGANVWVRCLMVKTGAVGAISYFGAGMGSVQNPGATLAVCRFGAAAAITAGAAGPGVNVAQVLSSTVIQIPSYGTGIVGAATGYSEGAIDLTVPQYINAQVNNSLVAGDSLAVISLSVALEF